MFLCGSLVKRAWRHYIEDSLQPYLVSSPMLVSASLLMKHWRSYMQVLHVWMSSFLKCTHSVCINLSHRPFPCRAQWPLAALLLWTSSFWCLRWSHRPVGILPSGCGKKAHADCRCHRSHIRNHPGHHEGDRVWRGGYPRTLQRSQYELGQRTHCRGHQLYHIRPYTDSPEEAASNGLYSMIVTERENNRGEGHDEILISSLKWTRQGIEWFENVNFWIEDNAQWLKMCK